MGSVTGGCLEIKMTSEISKYVLALLAKFHVKHTSLYSIETLFFQEEGIQKFKKYLLKGSIMFIVDMSVVEGRGHSLREGLAEMSSELDHIMILS